jgi:glutaconate CoA-transferase subunit A
MTDFEQARLGLEGKDRRRDKVTDLPGAAALVEDGDHVAIGGCLYSRTPMALLLQLLRAKVRDVTLSRCLMCYEGELFLADGASTHLVTSWMGIGFPWGVSRVLRTFVEEGRAHYEEWSHLALGLRYRAGAMGMPFLPTLSMLGSDLRHHLDVKEMDCPFTGKKLCLVPASFPDVALIHVHRADQHGNAQIDGYPHMDVDVARAAQKVILTTEQLVSSREISARADRTTLPHFVVDAVVEVPFGAYPHECYGLYDADFEHFDEYSQLTKENGVEGVRSYVESYVRGTKNHSGFLERFGVERILAKRRLAPELIAP